MTIDVYGFENEGQEETPVVFATFARSHGAAGFVSALQLAMNVRFIRVMDYRFGQMTEYRQDGSNWKISMRKLANVTA